MPEGMTRRKTNTTYFSQRGKTIHWKVELFFEKSVSVVIKKVNENMTLEKIIQKFLSDPYNKHTYSKFPALTIEPKDMTFLMIDCDSPVLIHFIFQLMLILYFQNHDQKFFELASTVPLKELFNGKRILEHPQIYVVKPEDKTSFSIVPSPPPLTLQERPQRGSKNAQKDQTEENKTTSEETEEGHTEEESSNIHSEGGCRDGEEDEDEGEEERSEVNCGDVESEHEEISKDEEGEIFSGDEHQE